MHGPGIGPRKWSRLGKVKEEVAFPKCASHNWQRKKNGEVSALTYVIEITLIANGTLQYGWPHLFIFVSFFFFFLKTKILCAWIAIVALSCVGGGMGEGENTEYFILLFFPLRIRNAGCVHFFSSVRQ